MDAVTVLTKQLAPDIQIRVRRISTNLREDAFVEVREFIPSAERYGRGIVLSEEIAETILHPNIMAKAREVEVA